MFATVVHVDHTLTADAAKRRSTVEGCDHNDAKRETSACLWCSCTKERNGQGCTVTTVLIQTARPAAVGCTGLAVASAVSRYAAKSNYRTCKKIDHAKTIQKGLNE